MIQKSLPFGLQFQSSHYTIFFGNTHFGPNEYTQNFSEFELRTIKQIHGNEVVLSTPSTVEADGHFTAQANLALQIKTADCLPIFIIDPAQEHIMGLHAGWRGVANQISVKGITRLMELGGRPDTFQVVIGPHIRRKSFEVDEPCFVELIDAVPIGHHHLVQSYYEQIGSQKYRVDLEQILLAQLESAGVSAQNIHRAPIDTVTDVNWHSHRRDRERAGRNLSFIVRQSEL